jgi:hypothetical protein
MIKLNVIEPKHWPQEDQDHMSYICSAVEVGLAPWNPGKITLYWSCYDSPFNPTLTIETELLPRLPFSSQLDLLQHGRAPSDVQVRGRSVRVVPLSPPDARGGPHSPRHRLGDPFGHPRLPTPPRTDCPSFLHEEARRLRCAARSRRRLRLRLLRLTSYLKSDL